MILDTDAVQQLNRPPFAPVKALPPTALVSPAGNGLGQLATNAFGRIKTGLRLLEDHRNVVAHQFAPFTRAELQQVDIVKAEAVGGDAPVIFGHAAYGFGDQAFS
ncbi:hypothetical protein D3C78_1502720 [compost metagenome]